MSTMERPPRLLVLGIGNVLMCDDGVGVHAIERLRTQPPAGARVDEVGIAMLDAVSLLARADRVLVLDALAGGGAPGSIYRMEAGDLLRESARLALHELDLLGAVQLLPPDQRPAQIAFLGVEPERIAPGIGLSPKVAAALPSLVRLVDETIAEWRRTPADAALSARFTDAIELHGA
jgi:hydrogenase maturation protease